MKIALFLGSFDPFHKGHLECINKALNDYKMDKVIIVPAMQNPWKGRELIDFNKRCYIIYKSLFGIKGKENGLYIFGMPDNIELSTIEAKLIPPYYSYATLHALKNKYCNDEIFILCGEDAIEDIPNWMNGEQIVQDYDFLVIDRPKNSISSSSIKEILRTRNKMDAYYYDEKLAEYVSPNVIDLLKRYYGKSN